MRQKEREVTTDRQTDRDTHTQTRRERHKHTERERDTETERQRQRETEERNGAVIPAVIHLMFCSQADRGDPEREWKRRDIIRCIKTRL